MKCSVCVNLITDSGGQGSENFSLNSQMTNMSISSFVGNIVSVITTQSIVVEQKQSQYVSE